MNLALGGLELMEQVLFCLKMKGIPMVQLSSSITGAKNSGYGDQ